MSIVRSRIPLGAAGVQGAVWDFVARAAIVLSWRQRRWGSSWGGCFRKVVGRRGGKG